MFTAVIEIPKGDDRRRHLNYAKTAFEDFGPIKDLIPINDGKMPIDYGFIKGTLNKEEGDEIDVLVISGRKLEIAQELEVVPIALIKIKNGDNKVVATDLLDTNKRIGSWDEVEQRDLILKYFGYKSPIVSIESKENAISYIDSNLSRELGH